MANIYESLRIASEFPFADAALDLHGRGLAVIPLGGGDGKIALVQHYPRMTRPPGEATIVRWTQKHGAANIGILCGLSRIVAVDIDDANLLEAMLARFGETPLIIGTRRGFQLWYRARGGERSANLRESDKIEVEIKAGPAAIIAVPPSWNRETGHPYLFVRGGWADLERLPLFRDRTKEPDVNRLQRVQSLRPNPVGTRNTSLFDYLRYNFSFASLEEVEEEALWYNQIHQAEPEPDSKVRATARSVWNYMTRQAQGVSNGPYVRLSHAEMDRLKEAGHLYPQALALFLELRRQHGGRATRGEPFAISAHGMSDARLIPGLTSRKRIEQIRRAVLELGLLIKLREARNVQGRFGAALYTFGPNIAAHDERIVPIRPADEE